MDPFKAPSPIIKSPEPVNSPSGQKRKSPLLKKSANGIKRFESADWSMVSPPQRHPSETDLDKRVQQVWEKTNGDRDANQNN